MLIGNRLQASAIVNDKVLFGTVNSEDVKDGEIQNVHLAANSIVSAAINGSQIGNSHIADGHIISRHIANDSITGTLISDHSMPISKLATSGCKEGDTFKFNKVSNTWACSSATVIEFATCAMGVYIIRSVNPVPPVDGSGQPMLNDPTYLQQLKDAMIFKYTSLNPPYNVEANAQISRNIPDFMNPDVCSWKKTATTALDQNDWVGCNDAPDANGWHWDLVSCQKVDAGGMWSKGIHGYLYSNVRAYYDKDIWPVSNKCVTGDLYKGQDWVAVSRPEEPKSIDGIIAVCARVK